MVQKWWIGGSRTRSSKHKHKLVVVVVVDEQVPHLAPEKRDFTATYTLGATMRQITYY